MSARATVKRHLVCFHRFVVSLFVHISKHQDVFGSGVLDYCRYETVHFFKIDIHFISVVKAIVRHYTSLSGVTADKMRTASLLN